MSARNLAFCVFLLSVVVLSACAERASRNEPGVARSLPAEYLWEGNPCGYLKIQKPLFSVSGWLTGPVKPNVTVDVYIAPNDSLEAALDVVVRCRQIGSVKVDTEGRFNLTNLPVGNYFVALPSREFTQVQGFPIVDEYEVSGGAVRMVWYGGSVAYSITEFSIRPKRAADGPGRTPP